MFYSKINYRLYVYVITIYTVLIASTIGTYSLKSINLFQLTDLSHNTSNTFNTLFNLIAFTLLYIIYLNKKTIINDKVVFLLFLLFLCIIFLLIYSNSSLIFFIAYELLLLLTVLIVYYNSPNIRAKTITLYFTVWTQVSSFLLWLAVSYLYFKLNTFNFKTLTLVSNIIGSTPAVSILIFISFAIKLPLWPFSFWLIKTHVEANTSFSIFLSGVLVKTALIGLIKFNFIFNNITNPGVTYIIILSLVITTFNITYQVDFKKLIAFTTVQEMTLITLLIYYNGIINSTIVIYFIVLHTLMSFLLFNINDIIYIRFKTRRTTQLLGLMSTLPKLSIVFIIIWLLFVSVPVSLKFIFEVLVLLKFFNLPSLLLSILIICLQFLTIIFFSKNTVSFLFGNGNKITYDLTKNDILNILTPLSLLAVFIV